MSLTEWVKKKLEKWKPEERFPERDERVTCPSPSCSRVMLFRDVFEHFFLKHTRLGQSKEEEEKDTATIHVTQKSIRGQLVDDYEAEWLEDEEEEEPLKIVQNGERKEELRKARMKNAWKDLLQTLKSEEKVEFGPNDHYGSLRGRHIGHQLERTLHRIDLPVEVEYKGKTTIVRKTGEISDV